MKRCLVLGGLLLAALPASLPADQAGGRRFAGYLSYGAGGYGNALGEALVGNRNDVSASYWNPAGLSGLRGFQVEDQYSILSLGQQLDYFALANGYRGEFYYGLSFFYYSAGGDLEARQGPSAAPDHLFGDTQLTAITSLAVKLSARWSLGLNLKLLTENFDQFSGIGFGEDLGLQFRLDRTTTLGLVARDPFTFMDYDNKVEDIQPPTFALGFSTHDEAGGIKVMAQLDWSPDLWFRPRAGVEWRPVETLALRGGAWLGDLPGAPGGGNVYCQPSLGFGLLFPFEDNLLEFDYCALLDRIQSGNLVHQVDLVGKFL